jgi:hypothetical protein
VACGSESEPPSTGTGGQAGAGGPDASAQDAGDASLDGGGGADADAAADAAIDAELDAAGSDADADADAPIGLPPVPLLSYEIELNKWVVVNEGDTVVRPVALDINWNTCASHDPDGTVTEIWLKTTSLKQLLGPGVACQEYTETDHDPQSLSGYLLVKDDQGNQSKLSFKYKTQ